MTIKGELGRVGTVMVLLAMAACGHTRAEPPPPSAVPPTNPDHEQSAETAIPVASSPQGLLREGAEKRLQLRLKERGLLTAAECTGQLDHATRKALRTFQRKEGLPATGLPSYETIDHLGLDLDDIFQTVAHPREPTRDEVGQRGGG